MPRPFEIAPSRLDYGDIAHTIDFRQLERDLLNESKLTARAVIGFVVVAVGMFLVIFGLDLSGMSFFITIFTAIGLMTGIAVIATHKATGHYRSTLVYDAVIREE